MREGSGLIKGIREAIPAPEHILLRFMHTEWINNNEDSLLTNRL